MGSSYNSYQLPLKYKQRLSNSNQIDNLSRDLAQAREHYEEGIQIPTAFTHLILKINKVGFWDQCL